MILQRKLCVQCKEVKPVDEYYAAPTKKDKLSSWCKECTRIYNREAHQRRKYQPADSIMMAMEKKPRDDEELERINKEAYRKAKKQPRYCKCGERMRCRSVLPMCESCWKNREAS